MPSSKITWNNYFLSIFMLSIKYMIGFVSLLCVYFQLPVFSFLIFEYVKHLNVSKVKTV